MQGRPALCAPCVDVSARLEQQFDDGRVVPLHGEVERLAGRYERAESLYTESLAMREGAAAAFQEVPPLVRAGGSPEAELLAFFEPVLFMILMRGGQAWARLVIAEAVRHPENAALFHECAVSRIADLVEGYLRSLSKEGLIPGKELRLCAENLISVAMMGPLNRGLLLGPKAPDYLPGIRHGVRMFLRGLMAKG